MSPLATTDWYVANTHVNAETTAAGHLRRQGFSVYLPLYKKLHSHARRRQWVSRPLFPRYLFVGIDESNQRWRAINSTIGISHLISFDGRPAPVDDAIITGLRAREDEAGLVTLATASLFKKGQQVKLMGGALSERLGLFDSIDDKMRVTVLLDLMGRQMRVRAPIETVQACT